MPKVKYTLRGLFLLIALIGAGILLSQKLSNHLGIGFIVEWNGEQIWQRCAICGHYNCPGH
jgi:hypothetical protein